MKLTFNWPNKVPKSERSDEFIQGMLNRVAVGFFRYGRATNNHRDQRVAAIKAMERYIVTHNKEFLIDVANYAMLEFMNPTDSLAYIHYSDSDPTPSLTAYFHKQGE